MFKNKAIFHFLGILLVSTSQATSSPEYIEHIFNDQREYLQGRICLERDSRGTLFLSPERPSRPVPQMSTIFDEPLEVLEEPPLSPTSENEESILGAIIPDRDGRIRIQDTTEWPYRVHTNLAMYFPNSNRPAGGSGVFIGPHHILTCGHNVYHPDYGWPSTIQAIPALNDGVAPFDTVNAARVYAFKEWVDRGNTNFDLALIVLEKSVGFQTGWSGLLCQDDQKLYKKEEINITGYPGDRRGVNSQLINPQMWTMSHKFHYISPERFHYLIDTFRGQSGSAIWINKWGQPYTLGIHTHGGDRRVGNSGVRLSKDKLRIIVEEWMNKTYLLREIVSISRPLPTLQPRQNSSPLTASTSTAVSSSSSQSSTSFLSNQRPIPLGDDDDEEPQRRSSGTLLRVYRDMMQREQPSTNPDSGPRGSQYSDAVSTSVVTNSTGTSGLLPPSTVSQKAYPTSSSAKPMAGRLIGRTPLKLFSKELPPSGPNNVTSQSTARQPAHPTTASSEIPLPSSSTNSSPSDVQPRYYRVGKGNFSRKLPPPLTAQQIAIMEEQSRISALVANNQI